MNRLDLSEPAERIFPRILARQARDNGDTPFLLNDQQSISFAEADAITDRLAAGLKALGIERGDRLCIYMGNSPEFVLITLAINKLGALWVPISTDYKGEWLADTLQRSRCKLVFSDAELYSRIDALEGQLDIEHRVLLGDGAAGWLDYAELATSEPLSFDSGDQDYGDQDYSDQDYGDTCAILWTSGTTGKSKGVMQSYNSWIRAIDHGASPMFDSHAGDVIYCALPLFNTGAWITSLYRALLEGIPCVIEPKFSVTDFWQRIDKFQATQTFLIGAMGVFLWNAPERPEDAETTLRKAMIVPFPPDIWKPFEQRFGLEILTAGLGMSECQLIANQLKAPPGIPPYALGYPAEDIELTLCDDEGNEVADGEAGEMCVRPLGPHILFSGYFDNPEATAGAYRGEFFLTGDMARRDPDTGALFFVDRKKDAVRFAGRNISTLEVESVYRRHPAVQDVAAFGIPSAEIESEDELKVNIVLKPGEAPGPEDICSFVNDNAPHYFVPRYLEFVDSLPYTPTNKVQKYKLREVGVTSDTWDSKQAGFKAKR